MQTPWGDAHQLRERMLRPGPGMPREEVERSQRERLFAAMVACVAAKGYEATTVADLLELSGVSRSAFYEHFRDRESCFLATFDAIVAKSLSLVSDELGKDGSSEERARAAMRGMFDVITHQPAAARLCFNEIYAVGERGRQAVDGLIANLTALVGDELGKIHDGAEVSGEMVQGVIGGAQSVVQSRLRRDEDKALAADAEDLWDWVLSYELPIEQLRLAGRRPRLLDGHPPPYVAYSQAERIIRALAAGAGERGYPAVTIAEIAARASVSQATFYSYFADKDAALLAALDSTGGQMLGVVMPAARRAPDWQNGVRAAIGALCAFCASEPDLARLLAVEIYAGGPVALEQRDRAIGQMRNLLLPGYEAQPGVKPIIAEAAFGAVWALLNAQIATAGPKSLPRVAPLASYLVLAPFVGTEEAVKVANGDGRGNAR